MLMIYNSQIRQLHIMSKKLKLFVMMLTCILLNVNYAWATDFEWTFPLSSTANSAYEDDDEQDATIIVKTSKGATHGGEWSHRTGVGSHFNVSAGGYFYISVPITNSTTSFTLQADIYGWKSSKYVAKNCTIKYYTSKLSTEAAVCNGATTTSGCYAVDQEITLPSTYKPTGSGTLYIKIYPEGGNIGFESLSVTICPTCGGSTKTLV